MGNRTWACVLAVPIFVMAPGTGVVTSGSLAGAHASVEETFRSQAELKLLMEHQKGRRYHKASTGYHDLVNKGLPTAESTYIRVRLGECLQAIGLTVAAHGVFQDALKLSANLSSYDSRFKAWSELVLEMPGAPIYGVQAISELDPKYDPPIGLPEVRYLRGLQYMQADDQGAALVAFQDVVSGDWLGAKAAFYEGVVYANQGLITQARSAFLGVDKRLMSLEDDGREDQLNTLKGQTWLNLARLDYAENDIHSAFEWYEQAQSVDANVGAELAWAHLKIGDPGVALQSLEQVDEQRAWPPETSLVASLSYIRSGQMPLSDQAMEDFKREVRAGQKAIRSLRYKYSRRKADQLALNVLNLYPFGEEAPEDGVVQEPLPEALRLRLMGDWRIAGARAFYEMAVSEMSWYDQQMPWWKETELGKSIPIETKKAVDHMMRQTGLRLLALLEAEEQALDQLIINAVLARKAGLEDQTNLVAYEGQPLPKWPASDEEE